MLTLKDFSLLNSPCIVCQNIPSTSLVIPHLYPVKPIASPPIWKFILKVSYSSTISWLVNPSSNSFSSNSNSLSSLLTYAFFVSSCPICPFSISSNPINLNLNKNFILPISLQSFYISIQDPHKPRHYVLQSNFNNKSSSLQISSNNTSTYLSLPLLNLPSSKTKLIKKIRNVCLFQ